MSMRIHACRPSLAAGDSETSRRHNKFKREVRARAAPNSVYPCKGLGATRPRRGTGRQRGALTLLRNEVWV